MIAVFTLKMLANPFVAYEMTATTSLWALFATTLAHSLTATIDSGQFDRCTC